jgi:membrane protease YdiL (CAAX protease family)
MESTDIAGTPAPAGSELLSQSSSSVRWGGIALFVVLAFAISWAIWLGLAALGVGFTIRTAIGMFSPAAAAALVRGPLRHEGFADAGLRLAAPGRNAVGMYIAAYVAPPLLIAAGIALSLLIGYQHWTDPVATLQSLLANQLAAAGQQVPAGMSLRQLAQIDLIAQLVLALSVGLLFNMIFTFGEEFGWRGYLLPRLAPLGGGWAALVTGIIWGLWHAPLIVLYGYNFPGHPWLGILGMVAFTTALSFVFAWLRFRSGSIWPSTLAHAGVNAQYGIGVLVLAPAGDSLLSPTVGLIGIAPIALLAVILLVTGRLKPASPTVR